MGFSKVSEMRLELTRHNCHYPLKVARLPIPPSGHKCGNILEAFATKMRDFRSKNTREYLSEKRDSNPRPQPWQGCALPTELFSRVVFRRPRSQIYF